MVSPRRYVALVLLASAVLAIFFVNLFRGIAQGTRHPDYVKDLEATKATEMGLKHDVSKEKLGQETLMGGAIAEHLGNETAKAELGRASWKLFHTVFARFPDKPTLDESLALQSYVYLFARLYPCGECAQHFQTILSKFPPQVTSRSTAAAWGCHVHNEVNKSLNKELFDCSNIGDFYDCGCAEGDKHGGEEKDSKVMGRAFDVDVH